jgi:tRNA(Ile)-lysidine synthase TilS/MesJ
MFREDFLSYMLKSFRGSINHKVGIRKKDQILVCFSGGYSSRALLQLLDDSWSLDEKNHLGIKISVLYVDTSDVFGYTQIEQDANLELVHRVCKSYNLTLLIEKMDKFAYKEDVFEIRLDKLIVDFARRNKFEKVMLGQNGTRLSSKLISDTSKGKGFSLPFSLAFVDNHHKDVVLCHPMRNFLAKEVGIYNYWKKLEICPTLTGFLRDSNMTVSNLSETFILKLSFGFPSTVHTILSSSEKLRVTTTEQDCKICG